MGFRFQKRFPLSKLIRLNVSKSGVSVSLGVRGADINIKGNKVTGNLGLSGTGLSYRKRLDQPAPEQEAHQLQPVADSKQNGIARTLKTLLIAIGLIVIGYSLRYWIAPN